MTSRQLKECMKDPSIAALDACIISIFLKAIKTGDQTKLSFLLDRAIGRPTPIMETDEERETRESIRGLSNEELIRATKEKIKELEVEAINVNAEEVGET